MRLEIKIEIQQISPAKGESCPSPQLRMAMIARCPVSWLTIEEEAGKEVGGDYKKEGQPARQEPGGAKLDTFCLTGGDQIIFLSTKKVPFLIDRSLIFEQGSVQAKVSVFGL